MCYCKRKCICLLRVNIVFWNRNMKQFHSRASQSLFCVAHCCSMSVWCQFADQMFLVLAEKVQNYVWSYCWSRAQEGGNITQPINVIGIKLDFFKILSNPSSKEWPVTSLRMILTKMFILLKYNLTFCINYDFQIVLLLFSVKVKNELCDTSARQLCPNGLHRDKLTLLPLFLLFYFLDIDIDLWVY
jgi:hypothetical protein